MIRLENVNKYFNRHKKSEIHVIDNTSLELPDKGMVALLGPSGCGKTTLLNTIGGLDNTSSGKIYINGKKINTKRSYTQDKIRTLNVGYIFQNYYLIDDKSVFDNVSLSLKMIGIKSQEEIKKRVDYVLECTGIAKYSSRKASYLSGGERQRVGIARAIVKNPNIILADEPTGNLDSKNTFEIMNILKSISKEKLVILVTHEKELANFYADRIIEVLDGKIVSDKDNKHDNELDYEIDNRIYLKDFKYMNNYDDINIYSDKKENLKLNIILKNNNIYIQSINNKNIEVINEDANIEVINDHYKKEDTSIFNKYSFDFGNITSNRKLKYSSVVNFVNIIKNGFRKIFDYSFVKKLLLIGFLASGAFITYSVCNIFGLTKIREEDFVNFNRDYKYVQANNLKDTYNTLIGYDLDVLRVNDYFVSFEAKYTDLYYQTHDIVSSFGGSIDVINHINESDIIYGRMPVNGNEIVVDISSFDDMFVNYSELFSMGVTSYKDYYNREVTYVGENVIPRKYIIVGFTDKRNYSIYVRDEVLNYFYPIYGDVVDYSLLDGEYKLTKGRLPVNEKEIIVNVNYMGEYVYNTTYTYNGVKYKIVGLYTGDNYYLLNKQSNPILSYINYLDKGSTPVKIYFIDNDDVNIENLNVKSLYDDAFNEYKLARKESLKSGLYVAGAILLISMLEIYLMIRASFLSRIKEVGIYRAIGIKKTDIYKMFFGEIFAITTLSCVPGVLFTTYSIKELCAINFIAKYFEANIITLVISILSIYLFNMLVGLLPVAHIIRKTPASILARKDLD